ncbi:DNA adenine methylase [Nitrospirillum amazonense]|uniref:DNA adenine methylase n=1 Tax=Nitrospirillum amazonense TaxID=28077 RepID=UPI002DD41E0D|nr:DNA adenine methylase [Nitrospirillum amazonense]MEC4591630.1 DNA adenine methylase [Nitrospirillum amazonense]
MTTIATAHRQFGSKARVAERILELLPPGARVWVDAFTGTAALTLAKPPHPVEHINDLNGDVTNLFWLMRSDRLLAELCRAVEFTPYSEEDFRACRDAVWTTSADKAPDQVERARQFLVASWQGFGGKQTTQASWRLEKSCQSVVDVWRSVPERLVTVAQRLRRVHVHRKDIFELVEMFAGQADAVLFLDPPYPRSSLNGPAIMYACDMTEDQHRQLAERLLTVKCKVLLTMARGTVYSDVLAGWTHTTYGVQSLTSSAQREVAITNYEPAPLFARLAAAE